MSDPSRPADDGTGAAPSARIGATALHRMKAVFLAALAIAAFRPARLENEVQTGAVIWKLRVELFDRVFNFLFFHA